MKTKITALVAATALACTCAPTAAFAYDVTSWTGSNGKTSFVYHDSQTIRVSGVKHVGVDVSEHNGRIDWKKVKADGVDYAIIRCGFGWDKKRSDRSNGTQEDYQFVTNVKNARAAGLKVGVYLYSYAWNKETAQKEAAFTLKLLKKAGLTPANTDLPVYYDLEEQYGTSRPCVPEKNSRGQVIDSHKISNRTLASMTKAWCGAIKAAGYKAGVYANTTWWNKFMTYTNSEGKTVRYPTYDKYSKWVAQYGKECTYSGSKGAWQFTSKGRVDGLGKCDVNFFYKSYTANSKFSVTYKLNNGKNSSSNPKTYYSSKEYKLYNPSRLGYVFKGWYTSSSYTTRVYSIKKGSSGNKTFYAKWARRTSPFQVSIVPSDGLNVRSTYSTSGTVTGRVNQGDVVTISKVYKDWGKLSDGTGWISLAYCKKA
ncbi:MAG: GH25 family lysozyme [Coriobacteriia bacterium]|nr:GH25 family lysozyme [Coriobacteriia bacterium]